MFKSKTPFLMILLFATALVAWGALRRTHTFMRQSSSAHLQQMTGNRQSQNPLTQDIPTPVQEGVMTERQREHSKLYKYPNRREKLTEIATTGQGEVTLTEGVSQRAFSPNSPPFNLQKFLQSSVCDSDAVVIGVVKNKASQLTGDETFIFTDYQLAIEEVIKNNPAVPIQVTGEITVTRPGGAVLLNGKRIRAVDESLEPLQLNERYILFLKFIPSTGAYKAFNSKGSFQVRSGKILKLTGESLPRELESGNELSLFLTEIYAAASGTCAN